MTPSHDVGNVAGTVPVSDWADAVGVRVVRGAPSDDEVVALIAGLATMTAGVPEPEEVSRPRNRWRDPARTIGLSPIGRKGGRGPDEWRWSTR